MTILQAIKEDLQPFPVSSGMITRKCLKRELNATSNVTSGDEQTILLIEIELLSQIITMSSVSEGGVSKSFDKEAATMLLKRLCDEAGVDAGSYVKESKVTFLEDWS